MSPNLWAVAVDAPLWQPLTYSAPPDLDIKPGQRVKVPLGRRATTGLVLDLVHNPGIHKLKDIQEIIAPELVLSETYRQWLSWLSRYYVYPLGQVATMVYPPLNKEGRGSKKKFSALKSISDLPVELPILTTDQKAVVERIQSAPGFGVHLLWGVTGSGKTEVYLRLIGERLARGQAALFLVPEIALTPQMIHRFVARFGEQVAVLHSQLTPREKTDQWWQIVDGKKKVLIGARSALFCPIPDLGLIVIDEEHESSFKQEDHLRYHARDAGIMLAKHLQIPIVLGSATPSLESYKKAIEKNYFLHRLTSRVAERPLPEISVVDLTTQPRSSKTQLPHWLSDTLFTALCTTFERGKQAALFLNRRGVAPTLLCNHCGYTWTCPNCAIQLTLHRHKHLLCHYCGYHQNKPEYCASCNEVDPKPLGAGTEKIEEDLRALFPNAKVGRADRDEIQTREDLEELIASVENKQIDILVGTQMIAKGLDFPGLDLVGIVLADVGFNVPDFRAAERAFQLMTQVSGRSGRHVVGDERGQVILQTYNPKHPAVHYTVRHDYEGFAQQELQARQELNYPPFARLCTVRISSPDKHKSLQAAKQFKSYIELAIRERPKLGPVQVLGPTEAPLSKLKGQYRHILMCKAPDPLKLSQALGLIMAAQSKELSSLRVGVDIDPYHLM